MLKPQAIKSRGKGWLRRDAQFLFTADFKLTWKTQVQSNKTAPDLGHANQGVYLEKCIIIWARAPRHDCPRARLYFRIYSATRDRKGVKTRALHESSKQKELRKCAQATTLQSSYGPFRSRGSPRWWNFEASGAHIHQKPAPLGGARPLDLYFAVSAAQHD